MLIPDFELDVMTRVLLPAFRAFYASPEGQAAFDGGGTSRRIHNKSDPATWTGAVCLCSDTIQINNKSEPIPDGEQVRIMLLWWTRRGSNPRPLRCERSALPAELRAQIGTFYTKKVAEFGFQKYSIFRGKVQRIGLKNGATNLGRMCLAMDANAALSQLS